LETTLKDLAGVLTKLAHSQQMQLADLSLLSPKLAQLRDFFREVLRVADAEAYDAVVSFDIPDVD